MRDTKYSITEEEADSYKEDIEVVEKAVERARGDCTVGEEGTARLEDTAEVDNRLEEDTAERTGADTGELDY